MWASHGLDRFCVRPYSVIGPELQVRKRRTFVTRKHHVSLTRVTRVDGLKHSLLQRKIAIFYINRRMVYAMRSIGCGQSSVSRLCSTMNMLPPVGSQPFKKHTKAILRAAKDVAEQTIKDAAQKSTTPRLRTVKTLWKLLFHHAMEHGKGDLPR